MYRLIFLVFILIVLEGNSQNSISGSISDQKTGNPIEFATVYVNGTTIGTISNSKGQFVLKGFSYPCTIIFSYVGYHGHKVQFDENYDGQLSVLLDPKSININTVTVPEKNRRAKNLELFRNEFLGANHWGNSARITNEEALRFEWIYELRQVRVYNEQIKKRLLENPELRWSADSLSVESDFPQKLNVSASEPLQIELPELGYNLHVDLVNFTYAYDLKYRCYSCGYLGYYFFKPFNNNETNKKIIRNRTKAYYHSPQHFCKSLVAMRLKQNGYRIVEKLEDVEGKEQVKRIELDSLLSVSSDMGVLTGLNHRMLYILYFSNRKELPVDLTVKKGRMAVQSNVYFLSDTCLIRADGTMPENTIMFSPEIGDKKIGASLPSNYKPSSPFEKDE